MIEYVKNGQWKGGDAFKMALSSNIYTRGNAFK